MKARTFFPLYVLIGIFIIAGLWVWTNYNGLITAQETMNASWAQVETQYQRRFDLIPNLVNTVRGASTFEQETLMGVTEARTKWLGAGSRNEKIEAATGFESAFSRLLVTVEQYPELTATQSYRDLMAQLEGTENRISVARRDYNDVVRSYNLRVKRFPGNLMAAAFGFIEEPFFEGAEGSENAPSVAF